MSRWCLLQCSSTCCLCSPVLFSSLVVGLRVVVVVVRLGAVLVVVECCNLKGCNLTFKSQKMEIYQKEMCVQYSDLSMLLGLSFFHCAALSLCLHFNSDITAGLPFSGFSYCLHTLIVKCTSESMFFIAYCVIVCMQLLEGFHCVNT